MLKYNHRSKTLLLPKSLGVDLNNPLKYFLILMAYPVLNIFVSFSLYLFLFIINKLKNRGGKKLFKFDQKSAKFYLFALISLFSFIFSPWENIEVTVISGIQLQIQYIYWMLISIFFMNFYKFINKSEFNKYIFLGLLLFTLNYFLYNFKFPIPIIRTDISRNGYVFTILALWPIASSHIYFKYGKFKGNLSLFIVFLLMLFTDGRAGVVIILVENVLIYFVHNKSNAKFIRIIMFVIIPFTSIIGSEVFNDSNRQALSQFISPFSSRIAGFIVGEGADGDLTFDKSWLTRKLMIDKGIEILSDYPFFGVGIGHYTAYKARLETFNSPEYIRLTGGNYDEDYYNHKSAHNSYVHIASEMGILGFVSLILILAPLIFYAIKKIVLLTITKDDTVLLSVVGMVIHFYSITSLPGSVTWFVIGIAYAQYYSIPKQRDKQILRLTN